MIKNILFDFDGVILDSMKIKGDGFVELFSKHNELDIKSIEEYHYKNGGISRFKKIEYFYKHILKVSITQNEIEELADKFSVIIENKLYNKENLIKNTIDFIINNYEEYKLHIVSGSEHLELNDLCDYFNLTEYFITINGSPTIKDVIVKNIMYQYNYNSNETILIGDSINDYNSAKYNKIDFYGFNNIKLKEYSKVYLEEYKELYK